MTVFDYILSVLVRENPVNWIREDPEYDYIRLRVVYEDVAIRTTSRFEVDQQAPEYAVVNELASEFGTANLDEQRLLNIRDSVTGIGQHSGPPPGF